jgi:hypothetical protein
VIDCLGHPQPFFPEGTALGECAQLGMALGEVGTGAHGRQESLAEVLVTLRPLHGRHHLYVAVDRPRIVALSHAGCTEVVVPQRTQPPPSRRCQGYNSRRTCDPSPVARDE